jgi:aminopeptidase N
VSKQDLLPRPGLIATAVALQAAAEEKQAPKPIFRKDYKPTPYLVDTVDLTFKLGEEVTHVHSKLHLKPNQSEATPPALFLHGREDVKLVSVKVNGADVAASGYQVGSDVSHAVARVSELAGQILHRRAYPSKHTHEIQPNVYTIPA